MPTPSLNSNFIFPRANARSVLPQPIRPQSKTATTNDKLTMKTRIAVRDANPHRFEVVQLREAVSRVSSPMLKEITPLGNARAQLKTVNTGLKAIRRSIPSIKRPNENARRPLNPDGGSKTSVLRPPISDKTHHQNLPPTPAPQRSSLRKHTTPNFSQGVSRNTSGIPSRQPVRPVTMTPSSPHFKSASLGMSHTLHSSSPRTHSSAQSEDMTMSPIRMKSNSHRRRAIYAQSLFVPSFESMLEEPTVLHHPRSQLSQVSYTLIESSVDYSSPVSPTKKKEDPQPSPARRSLSLSSSRPQSQDLSRGDTLVEYVDNGDIVLKPSLSYSSSLPSLYSQDSFAMTTPIKKKRRSQIRPATFLAPERQSSPRVQQKSLEVSINVPQNLVGEGNMSQVEGHHPIVVELLVAIDMAMREWRGF